MSPIKGFSTETPTLNFVDDDLSLEGSKGLIQPLYSFLQTVETDSNFVFDSEALDECQGVLNLGNLLYSSSEFSPWELAEYIEREDLYNGLLSCYKTVRADNE